MAGQSGEFAVETSTFVRLIAFNPYQEARFFQLQLFSLASSRAGFQPHGRPLSQLINFNQTNSGPTTVARKSSGIVSSRDSYNDGRFQVVRRRQASRLNGRLLRVFPIIIRVDDIAVAIAQANEWVCQRA